MTRVVGRRASAVGAALLAVLVSAMLAGCGSGAGARGASGGSCVAPYLDARSPADEARARTLPVDPTPHVKPGDSIVLYGHWYATSCDDTGVNGKMADDPIRPMPPVHLTLTLPGGTTTRLGPFGPAGSDMGFRFEVRIPPGTPAGPATVADGHYSKAAEARAGKAPYGEFRLIVGS